VITAHPPPDAPFHHPQRPPNWGLQEQQNFDFMSAPRRIQHATGPGRGGAVNFRSVNEGVSNE
jgi:hypothetical protein